ncbi:MAG: beta-ketoacyl synthase N-terminal-like domain-containing protein [Candidatus Competibacteraceae bacterium]
MHRSCYSLQASPEFSTLVELLRYRGLYQSEQIAFIFLADGEQEADKLTYHALDQQARMIAVQLQGMEMTGERALLLYPPGLEFIAAFFGCLYAGVVSVPMYPPQNNHHISRLRAIAANAQATHILTTASLAARIEELSAQSPELARFRVVATDQLASDWEGAWQQPALSSDTLAFIQYTSGSTGTPKGVMVSHGNLLHNQRAIKQAFDHSESTIYVSWLPLFHDMGLIGNVLQPLYLGVPCIFMAPAAFLQKPFRWLQAISHYRATTSGGPNFAYDLCVSKITPEQRANLDLSSWTVAFNGAEPVRADTLDRFNATFGPCGFHREAFYPCYGMAEATLFISGGIPSKPPHLHRIDRAALEQNQVMTATDKPARTFVSCGRTWLDDKLVIVDPDSRSLCPSGQVGEVWVAGPSVAQGYWNRTEQTRETFQAYLADNYQEPFMRTGDLGYLQDDELFITGRLKDLLIIRGRNHYPQDIELTVEKSHPALRAGCGAAFAVEFEGSEQLVVAQEVRQDQLGKLDTNGVVGAIRQAIAEQHELQVYAVLLLKTNSIPKTSSGKLQRHACRAGFLSGDLNILYQWQQSHTDSTLAALPARQDAPNVCQPERSRLAIQDWLVASISWLLKIAPDQINVRDPLAHYGLDSSTAVILSGDLETWLGRRLSPTLAYDYPSIQALAEYLAEEPRAETARLTGSTKGNGEAIAIIGIGCRFPGANGPDAFWQCLCAGFDAITEVPSSRWDIDAFYDPKPATPAKMNTRWGGFLEYVDQFDPQFFGISPREAIHMDPQQRLLLEVSWEALEHAGQAPEQMSGSRTGVFMGISSSDYFHLQRSHAVEVHAYSGTGNALSIGANRLSYLLDLRGPSWTVDTACSSSLVAVHQACQSLRQDECDLALSGGVNLVLTPDLTISFSQAQMLAADGRCKTFDAAANGYVRGEGCGVVVLKRLSDARRAGDPILAVIKGSAVNQDGRSNGLTAPNGYAQRAVIRQALECAQVAPAQIGYLEAHGTGTALGDPIEVNALKDVLLEGRPPFWGRYF